MKSTSILPPSYFENTYLDSHIYQVFSEFSRVFTPRQHIAYTCRHDLRYVESCCRDGIVNDPSGSNVTIRPLSRLVGEWTAAFDKNPSYQLSRVMGDISRGKNIGSTASPMTEERRAFLRRFVEAQMVAYESARDAKGWFFWNFKVE